MRLVLTLLFCLLAAPAFAQTTVTMGDTKVEAAGDSGNGNLIVAQQVTLSQIGSLNSLVFNVGTPSGTLILGVYSDVGGKPGVLLAQTPSFTPVKGWNPRVPTATPVLQPGTYWLAYAPSSNNLTFFKQNNSGNCYYVNRTYQAMPAAWPTSGVLNCTPTTWSFYASLVLTPLTPPVVSVPPAISGVAQVGSALTSTTGTWSGSPLFTYQWQSGGVAVAGATANSYTAQVSDVGNTLTVTVTATNSAGSAQSTSAPTAAVTQPPPPADYGPDNVIAIVVSPTEVDIGWSPVLNAQCYQIMRDGTQIGTSTTPAYQDKTVVHGTVYSYTVSAVISVQSLAASASP